MLLCKKRERATGQAAAVRVGPTTGQPINGPEECTRNKAVPTSFSFSSAFKQEMMNKKGSLNLAKSRTENLITSAASGNLGNNINIGTTLTTIARITDSNKETGDSGTDSSSSAIDSQCKQKSNQELEGLYTTKL